MSTLGKKTVDDIEVKGKRVLVRVDFNVPLKDGVITNDNRIVAALPTIKKLIEKGGKVILCSHLGKPKNGPEAKFSLAPCAVRLSELLGQPVVFAADDCVVGENAKKAVAEMKDGDVVLLENTRFRKEETKNLPEFSKDLASITDVYVNDAFGSAHRAHCSTAGITEYIKESASGYLMNKEIEYLGNAVNDPVRPFVAILGGAKVADKLNVIENLLNKADALIIGGGMAFTFLKAQGFSVGKSLVEDGAFAIEVLEHINKKIAQFKEEDGNLYAIYGTPAESLCGLQVKQFRAKYGIIEGVSDREYVFNSFHCHVTEEISPIQKQDLEGRFWELCNGGKIQYVKYPIDYNLEAIKTLIHRAMDKGFYEGVNMSLAYCDDCGHQELEMDVCPKCGSKNLTKIDRMNGYLSYSRVHGDTRLNEAKMAEIAERKSM